MRATKANFNNELGVPLTVLGDWEKIEGRHFWLKVIAVSAWRLLVRAEYPELLVLEYAADKPGDIGYLLEIARPYVAAVTAIGDVPVHVEFYSGPEAVAREKAKVIEALPENGIAVLNYDDAAVRSMRERTKSRSITYGFSPGADVVIINFEHRTDDQGKPLGIAFKLNYSGSFVPVRIDGVFGKAQAYAAAAAACIGLSFGMNLVKIAEALSFYKSPAGRTQLFEGMKESLVIDDSYNASPLSMKAAFDAAHNLKAKRKIGILGDMRELGRFAKQAHEDAGELAANVFDILITVGQDAKYIAEAAKEAGMPEKHIFSYDNAGEAKFKAAEILKKGDLVLVKASHSIGLERVVEHLKKV